MLAILKGIAQLGAIVLGAIGFESIKNSFNDQKEKVQKVDDIAQQGTVWTTFLFGLVMVVALAGWIFPLSPNMMKKIKKGFK